MLLLQLLQLLDDVAPHLLPAALDVEADSFDDDDDPFDPTEFIDEDDDEF